jgi:hypothetical protein
MLLGNNIYGFTLNISSNSEEIESSVIKNKKSKNNIYSEPTVFDNTIVMKGWEGNNLQNGNFESDIDNWDYDTDADDGTTGASTDELSGVSHDSKYVWGKSYSSFIKLKDFTLTQRFDFPHRMETGRYQKIDFDYGSTNNKDYGRINIILYNQSDKKKDTWTSSKLQSKDGTVKHYSIIDNFGTKDISYGKVLVGMNNKDKSGHIEAFIDNIKVSTLEYYHYGTQDSDNITYPTIPVKLRFYSWQSDDYGDKQTTSNNLLKPDDFEDWTEETRIYTSKGTDYIYLPVGSNNYVNSYYGDDTIVSYLGNKISDNTYIDAYKGDDKVYAPIKGSGHDLNGGPGWDTLVLMGVRSDYNIKYEGGTEYTIKKSGLKISVFDFESFAFSTKSPLDTLDGNTNEWEEYYVTDEDDNFKLSKVSNILLGKGKEVDGMKIDDYMETETIKFTNLQIDNDIDNAGNDITVFILGLPENTDYILDSNNIKWLAETKTNEDGEVHTEVKMKVKDNSLSNLKIYSVKENTNEPLDLSNISINRSF